MVGRLSDDSVGPAISDGIEEGTGMAEIVEFASKCGRASISSSQETCKPMSGDLIATHASRACSSAVVLKTPFDLSGRIAASMKPLWTAGLVCGLIETTLSA